MIKLVVFDLDGTLLHTLTDLTNSVNYGLQKVGVAPVTEKAVRDAIGNGTKRLVRAFAGGGEVGAVALAHFTEHYTEHFNCAVKPYIGAVELVQQLQNRGVAVAVYSNKNDNLAKLLIQQFFGDNVQTVGQREGVAVKPNPEGLLQLMQLHNADSSNTLYVGDSLVDVNTAKNGEVDSISVSYGYDNYEDLVAGGATMVVNTVEELAQEIFSRLDK